MSPSDPEKKTVSIINISEIDARLLEQCSKRSKRICGLRRRHILIIAVVLALCLGLGVGIGTLHSRSNNASTPASTTNDTSASTSMVSTSTAKVYHVGTTTTTSTPKTTGTVVTTCPSTNGTIYHASGHTFLILCGNDIQAPNKVEVSKVYEGSFDSCIDLCAAKNSNRADISAVYLVDYAGSDAGTCYCYGGTSQSNSVSITTFAANDLAWIQS